MLLLPNYIHIVNPKLKHIYLQIDDRGELVIKSPNITQEKIEQIILKKSSWIRRSKEKIQNKKGRVVDFSHINNLYFLGKSHPFKLRKYTKKYTKLYFDGDTFELFYSHFDEKTFLKKIDLFYKEESRHYIPPLLDKWSKKMQLLPKELSLRKTKRQWGSCSPKNKISINTMVMKLPLSVIEYIVVHELAHIKHKHHQKKFWDLIEKYLPDYKISIKKLKQFST